MSNDYGISSQSFTATLPAVLKGATFNSVSISYTKYYQSVGFAICWADGLYNYFTNESLLQKLQNRELDDTFTLQMVKYAKGVAQFTDLVVSVDYNPASDVSGTINIGDSSVYYSAPRNSICGDETMSMLLSVNPSEALTGISLEVADSARTEIVTKTVATPFPAGSATTAYVDITLGETALASRVNDAYIRVGLITASGTTKSAWTKCGTAKTLHLVRNRVAPSVTVTVTDTSSALAYFGKYVATKSTPRFTLTATLDTAADDTIALSARSLTLTNGVQSQSFEGGNNVIDVDELIVSGAVSYTVTVTDTYGVSGTKTGTMEVLAYSPPSISALSFERYAERETAQGEVYYELDDSSPLIWTNITAAVSALNGHNAWTLEAEYTDDVQSVLGNTPSNSITHTVIMTSDTDGRAISATEDRELFTPELLESSEWAITVYLTDYYGYATKTFIVSKSGAIFDIEKGGVAIGKRSEGTELSPLFEVNYPAIFYNNVEFRNLEPISWTSFASSLVNCSEVSTYTVGFCVKMGVAYLRGAIHLNSALSSGSGSTGRLQIATLPMDIRPLYRHEFAIAVDNSSVKILHAWIEANTGKMYLENRSGYAVGTNLDIFLSASFVVF